MIVRRILLRARHTAWSFISSLSVASLAVYEQVTDDIDSGGVTVQVTIAPDYGIATLPDTGADPALLISVAIALAVIGGAIIVHRRPVSANRRRTNLSVGAGEAPSSRAR